MGGRLSKSGQTDCRSDTTAKGNLFYLFGPIFQLVRTTPPVLPFAVVSALQSVWFVYT